MIELEKINKMLRVQALKTIALVCVPVLFLFCSCSSFLEEKPETSYSTQQFFSSVDRLSMATLGIYEPLSLDETYGKNIPSLEATTDIEINKATSVTSSPSDLGQICNFNIMTVNAQIEALWKWFYDGVNRANSVLAYAHLVPIKSEKDATLVKKYIAEAKVLRAFIYLDLVKRWGDVPFRTEPADMSADIFVGRTPRKEIYDHIIRDLEEAIIDLPWHDEELADKGRIHKGAAMGILTRVCLFAGGYSLYMDGQIRQPENYREYYEKADAVSRELIASGKHKLNPNFENVFYKICQNVLDPLECLFEIEMAYVNGSGKHASGIGSNTTGVAIKNNLSVYNCTPRVFTHFFMYQKYGEGDLRRSASVANYYLDGKDFRKVEIAVKSSINWSCAKWRRDWHANVPTNWAQTDVNNVVLRYSDVLLMRAEILNELNDGPTPESIELVNQVRRRGYGLDIYTPSSVADLPAVAMTDKTTFFDFITDEYAREFLGEGGRRFHLIRWNIMKSKMDEMKQVFSDPNLIQFHGLKTFLAGDLFTSGKHELYPIPYREMMENKGVLGDNNPGY